MFLIICLLLLAAAGSLVYCLLHGRRYGIRVHYYPAVRVSRGATYSLYQRRCGAQESLLVRVQYGNETHLRKIQSLPQEVYAYQNVKLPQAQVADYLHSLYCLDFRVHVPHPYAHAVKIFRQHLRHSLCKGSDQHPFPLGGGLLYLAQQIVHLSLYLAHLNLGIQQSCGAYHLLRHLAGPAQFILAGCSRYAYELIYPLLKLVKLQGSVVIGARYAEAVIHEGCLSG